MKAGSWQIEIHYRKPTEQGVIIATFLLHLKNLYLI